MPQYVALRHDQSTRGKGFRSLMGESENGVNGVERAIPKLELASEISFRES